MFQYSLLYNKKILLKPQQNRMHNQKQLIFQNNNYVISNNNPHLPSSKSLANDASVEVAWLEYDDEDVV